MFLVKSLTVKNFMSVGNTTQAINFDRRDLTLVLGENLDLGGDDAGARNGTGKTTIINALSYALYGVALTNIKRDNLINHTNAKSMLVTIDFDLNGVSYRIERGRRPAVFTFYIGGDAQKNDDNDAQGDSRETQAKIETILGMSHDMFKHVVALNTYTTPFLSMITKDQRTIIEQLLGITMLSEKAEVLKKSIIKTKDTIQYEEQRCAAVNEANKRILEQIESLKRRDKLWASKRDADVIELRSSITSLSEINIDDEISNHEKLSVYTTKKQTIDSLRSSKIRLGTELNKITKSIEKTVVELDTLAEHKCHACGQEIHDEQHERLLSLKTTLLNDSSQEYERINAELIAIDDQLKAVGDLGDKPFTHYSSISDAYNHKTSIDQFVSQLATREAEVSPYTDQIQEMESTAIVEFDYSVINDHTRLKDHQEFLLKLLTNKDSFIRKQIIDQNLAFLNGRLSAHLSKMGLPHSVEFQNDLTVDIQELGRELDFDNLSRGERNRLILSLSWAFRDVWESLYHPINLLFIDELIDSGMDSSGVDAALSILKRMSRDAGKSVWLVSHKDELTSRVSQVMKVIKENGFTSYDTPEYI